MDLTLTPDELSFRQSLREFIAAHRHLAPPESDTRLGTKERRLWQQLLLTNGFLGRTVPSRYGGYGAKADLM